MSTATSRSERFRAISSPMALVVAATKRRDTADLDIDLERPSSSAPTGSATSAWRRVATPASMRSTTRELSRSAELNAFQVSSPISAPALLRPRGRSVLTWRPPSTTEPLALPCQFPTRSCGRDLGVLRADRLGQFGLHHLAHHDEPGGRGEGQQPVLDRSGHVGQGHCRLERQVSQSGCLLRVGDAHNSYLLLHGGPLPKGYLVVPDPYQLAGLRRGTTALLQQCSGQRLSDRRRHANVLSASSRSTTALPDQEEELPNWRSSVLVAG